MPFLFFGVLDVFFTVFFTDLDLDTVLTIEVLPLEDVFETDFFIAVFPLSVVLAVLAFLFALAVLFFIFPAFSDADIFTVFSAG